MTRPRKPAELPDPDEPAPPARPRASAYPEPVDRLIECFARMPGIGRRTAERLAFYILKSDPDEAQRLAAALTDVKQRVKHCRVCYNLTAVDPCAICSDPARDRACILVVEQPRDLIALEQTGAHKGLYHVLMGRISPLEGVGPGHLTIADLLQRIDRPERNAGAVRPTEVILGLNPNLEGDGTALYLADELAGRAVRVTRLARGLPSGGQLEFATKAVLADALLGRQQMP